jgi:hypothetical protein
VKSVTGSQPPSLNKEYFIDHNNFVHFAFYRQPSIIFILQFGFDGWGFFCLFFLGLEPHFPPPGQNGINPAYQKSSVTKLIAAKTITESFVQILICQV